METRLTKSNNEQRLETAKIIFDYLPDNNVFKVNETKETMSAKAVAYNGIAALIWCRAKTSIVLDRDMYWTV